MHRRGFLVLTAFASLASVLATAERSLAGEPAVFTGIVAGTGAGGYDVVAYQSGSALPGDAGLTAEHEGVTYRFANAENRAAFTAAPGRYLPQYGGYCAWAVANGYTAKGDPEAWTVVSGKLYLNYSKSVRKQWSEDIAGNIAKGEANWPKVLD